MISSLLTGLNWEGKDEHKSCRGEGRGSAGPGHHLELDFLGNMDMGSTIMMKDEEHGTVCCLWWFPRIISNFHRALFRLSPIAALLTRPRSHLALLTWYICLQDFEQFLTYFKALLKYLENESCLAGLDLHLSARHEQPKRGARLHSPSTLSWWPSSSSCTSLCSM